MAKILVVEDTDTQRELLAELLRAEGHMTTTARDGAEGLRRATEELPDVIVTDLLMPRMDGEQMARSIRGLTGGSGIPIIAVTALELDRGRMQKLEDLFRSILRKPIDLDDLFRELRSAVPPSAGAPRGRRDQRAGEDGGPERNAEAP